MSPDRVVYSFVVGWVLLVALLILLDWLGNVDRGPFRPKGDRPPRGFAARHRRRRRLQLEEDAAVRATLRDAYGASSLRLTWTRALEDAVRGTDDRLVRNPDDSQDELDDAIALQPAETVSLETVQRAHEAVVGDPLPNPGDDEAGDDEAEVTSAETECGSPPEVGRQAGRGPDGDEEPEPDPDPEPDPQPDPTQIVGWRVGVHPLARTRKGAAPSPSTVRTRAWKNHGEAAWDTTNRERVRAGKAPRRANPVTGRTESASVDVDTGRARWPDDPVDPFDTP